jgi:hypothetical protein
LYGNNTSEADCCFHSIKPLYRYGGKGQAKVAGLADRMVVCLPIGSRALYGSNAGGRLVCGIFESRTESVVKKRQKEQYKKKCGGGQTRYSVTSSDRKFSGIRLFRILNFFLGGFRGSRFFSRTTVTVPTLMAVLLTTFEFFHRVLWILTRRIVITTLTSMVTSD